jgi:hypothetical protein
MESILPPAFPNQKTIKPKYPVKEASHPPRRASDGSLEVLLWTCRG